MMITTNTPITINGQTCILVRDVIGSGVPTDNYTSQEQGSYRVWYQETTLKETRETHPDLPIYGFWQTLLASDLIVQSNKLQFVYVSEQKDFGYYIYINGDFVHTGTIFNDELQTLPSIAITEGVQFSDGIEINVRIDDLRLPDSPLLTNRERTQIANDKKKKSQQQLILTISLIIGFGVLADYGLSFHHQRHMVEYGKIQTRLAEADAMLRELSRKKLLSKPNQESSLSKLYQVAIALSGADITAELNLLPYQPCELKIKSSTDMTSKLALLNEKGISTSRLTAQESLISWVNDEY